MKSKKESVSIAGVKKHTTVNGPGVRYTVFMQGCEHGCKGCHNPETHDLGGGEEVSVKELIDDILATKYIDGVTLSGGDPLLQAEQCRDIVEALKSNGLDIWLYSGFTFDEVAAGKAGEAAREVLDFIDVMVDGRFIESLKSEEHIWRGSSNQRLIDVRKSLDAGEIISFDDEFVL